MVRCKSKYTKEELEKFHNLAKKGKRFPEDQCYEVLRYKGRNSSTISGRNFYNTAEELIEHPKNGWAKTPAAQDPKILKLDRGSVAFYLAANSKKNDWAKTKAAQNPTILKLKDGMIVTYLAWVSDKNGWAKTPAAQDPKYWKYKGFSGSGNNGSVLYWLIKNMNESGWDLCKAMKKSEFMKILKYNRTLREQLVLTHKWFKENRYSKRNVTKKTINCLDQLIKKLRINYHTYFKY